MHISASLQNKAILHHPRKSTILLLLANVFVMHVHHTHTHTFAHRILLCACALVGDALVSKTHTNPCPHGMSILWQKISLPHLLKTLFSHEGLAKMLLPLASLTFRVKLVAHVTLCSWLPKLKFTVL